jgi:hypothetical protein
MIMILLEEFGIAMASLSKSETSAMKSSNRVFFFGIRPGGRRRRGVAAVLHQTSPTAK